MGQQRWPTVCERFIALRLSLKTVILTSGARKNLVFRPQPSVGSPYQTRDPQVTCYGLVLRQGLALVKEGRHGQGSSILPLPTALFPCDR